LWSAWATAAEVIAAAAAAAAVALSVLKSWMRILIWLIARVDVRRQLSAARVLLPFVAQLSKRLKAPRECCVAVTMWMYIMMIKLDQAQLSQQKSVKPAVPVLPIIVI
jgi:hypothetical protein